MELSEALYTTRAMRRVAPDPVPEEVVAAMMDAAVRAPSGGNSQNWRWMTVTDPETKAALGPLYREAWEELQQTVYAGRKEAAEARGDESALRVMPNQPAAASSKRCHEDSLAAAASGPSPVIRARSSSPLYT